MQSIGLFFACWSEQALEEKVELKMIWDTMSFMRLHCNDITICLQVAYKKSIHGGPWEPKSDLNTVTTHMRHVVSNDGQLGQRAVCSTVYSGLK